VAAVVTNLLYLTISLALVAVVGRALSRSSRAFLGAVPGGQDGVPEAVSRLLVVAFYLLSLGFIALTMQVWSRVGNAAQALQLVSVKTGELLLVLGALHLAGTAVLARLRRARSWAAKAGPGAISSGTAGRGDPVPADSGTGSSGTGSPAGRRAAGRADYQPSAGADEDADSPELWRPRPGHAIH